MFQDNPLLAQLKQQLHSQTPRVEGVVKGTDKGFGFLEVDAQKSYFIPPPYMKKSCMVTAFWLLFTLRKIVKSLSRKSWLSLS